MKTNPNFKRRSALAALAFVSPLVAMLPATASAQACPTPNARLAKLFYGSGRFVSVIAHRGLWGDFNAKGKATPENSYDAVVAAGVACMDAIELDVKMSSDGVPVLMHDYNLGRTTDVFLTKSGAAVYNPDTNTGYNPLVSSLPVAKLTALRLLATGYRTPGGPNQGKRTGNGLPEMKGILSAWRALPESEIAPLVFDVKTAAAVRAIDAIAMSQMSRPGDRIAMKVNASLYQSRAAYTRDAPHIKGIPVLVTNNLGNIDITAVYRAWVGNPEDAIEINVKSVNGILQGELNSAKSSAVPFGVFNAIPDYPGSKTRFYDNDGHCCYTLADKLYTYKGVKEPSDQRGDWNYINNQGFTFVTTDDPRGLRLFMAGKGRH